MKRLLAAGLALIVLLCGCGSGPSGDPPAEASISICALEGPTDFGSFTADAPASTSRAEALISAALTRYPGSLLEALDAQILLCADLTGGEAYSGGSYAGFTLPTDDGWLIVLDADACDEGTVHHELAHILDAILTDAGLLTEEDWLSLCPSGFSWGDTDWEDYPDFFCDWYAMQNIREDRARTFEEAMLRGPGVFDGKSALWLKLELFSRCLRAHFAADDWPVQTAWEQALD